MDESTRPARQFLVLGSILAGIGVAAGAFGAHGLKEFLSPDMLATYETAVRYQMYHSLALIATGLYVHRSDGAQPKLASGAAWFFVAGILLFSGSLYALTLTGFRWLGLVTPLGGIAFLIGWGMLAMAAWKRS